jgi:signal transduction histidine kinase
MSDPTQHLNTFDPDEDLSNARGFDAFFTTIADGTRLGLPLVAVIDPLHRGELELSPKPSPLGVPSF